MVLQVFSVFDMDLHQAMFPILRLETVSAAQDVLCISCQNRHFWIIETIRKTSFFPEHVHHTIPQKNYDSELQFLLIKSGWNCLESFWQLLNSTFRWRTCHCYSQASVDTWCQIPVFNAYTQYKTEKHSMYFITAFFVWFS